MTNSGTPDNPQYLRDRGRRNRFKPAWLRKLMRIPGVALIVDVLGIVATALVLSLLIKTFLIRSFFIPSGSMMNTLQVDDRIIVNELVPNVIPLQRGDVVVFRDPGGWLSPIESKTIPWYTQVADWFLSSFGVTAPDSDQHLVKRVIGVAGDHIVCCTTDGKLTINGVPITEPYVIKGSSPSDTKFDVTVPANSFWVMGDNRPNSEDSRYHGDLPSKGFVPKSAVVGRAFVLTWPFSHFTWLDNFPSVFQNVPNP